jgi:hypothetical protein
MQLFANLFHRLSWKCWRTEDNMYVEILEIPIDLPVALKYYDMMFKKSATA